MARRSRIEGVTTLRRKLRRVDPAITAGLRDIMKQNLEAMAATERSLVPVDTGDMRDSIQLMVSRDGMSGIVGPGARAAEIVRRASGSEFSLVRNRGKRRGERIRLRGMNKRLLMQFYKAYWLNFGTKGAPSRNILPQSPLKFVEKTWAIHQRSLGQSVRAEINRSLRIIANG